MQGHHVEDILILTDPDFVSALNYAGLEEWALGVASHDGASWDIPVGQVLPR